MRLTMIGAAVGLMVLAGCDGSTEPAQPPTQEDALTTATVAPPTPSDEVDVTTEAAPTTAEPTTEVDAGGPPELPEEATEQTQESAIAFAEHFIEVVNYTGIDPVAGMISNLSEEACETCANLENTVVYSEENENYLSEELWEVTGDPDVLIFAEDGALVRLPVRQLELPVLDSAGTEIDRTESATYNMALDLGWTGDSWQVRAVEFG